MCGESDEDQLLKRLRAGDAQAQGELFMLHRQRLWRVIHFRLDRRLRGRIDADDVLQEAFLSAASRITHFLDSTSFTFFIWLRTVAIQTLIDLHRRHIGTQQRDAGREVSLPGEHDSDATSSVMASYLSGNLTSPSGVAMRQELVEQLERAINEMSAIDQDVLALRHFEELTNSEVAEVLAIQEKAASIRYVRALKRLKEILSATQIDTL